MQTHEEIIAGLKKIVAGDPEFDAFLAELLEETEAFIKYSARLKKKKRK